MAATTPSVDARQDLIFWTAGDAQPSLNRKDQNQLGTPEEYDEREDEKEDSGAEEQPGHWREPSMYVQLFEDMINVVTEYESHLLSDKEKECLITYSRLSYNARYILVRLCLRKAGKWHRLADVKYERECGSRAAILDAMNELCGSPALSPTDVAKIGSKRGFESAVQPTPKAKRSKTAWNGSCKKIQQTLHKLQLGKGSSATVRIKREPEIIDLLSDTEGGAQGASTSAPPPPPDVTAMEDVQSQGSIVPTSQPSELATATVVAFVAPAILIPKPEEDSTATPTASPARPVSSPSAANATTQVQEVKIKLEPYEPDQLPFATSSKVKQEDFGPPKCLILTERLVKTEEDQGTGPIAVQQSSFDRSLQADDSPLFKVMCDFLGSPLGSNEEDLSFFAQDERCAEVDLRKLLSLLPTQELKDICTHRKLKKRPTKREDMITAILASMSKQAELGGLGRLQKPQERFKGDLLKQLVKIIRVNPAFVRLLRRIDLIYFRRTQRAENILTPSILQCAKKRNYIPYEYIRTPDVWITRDALLLYEVSLEFEATMDEISGGGDTITSLSLTSKLLEQNVAQEYTEPTANMASTSKKPTGRDDDNEDIEIQEVVPVRIVRARQIKRIFELVYPEWTRLVKLTQGAPCRKAGMERFESGHVLTRIVSKSVHAMKQLGEWKQALEVTEALLAQRRWRRGRRGSWHDNRALIMMKHWPKTEDACRKIHYIVMEALRDEDTHLIYRAKLERRLTKLEKKLQIPEEERHTLEGNQKKCFERIIVGDRIRERTASLSLDGIYRPVHLFAPDQRMLQAETGVLSMTQTQGNRAVSLASSNRTGDGKRMGKSIWRGREGAEVNVETFALQWYEDNEGFRGFHGEGRVVRAIYALVFWDIIFAPVVGAFETAFQTAPLDIADESFYHARKELIEARLNALESDPEEAVNRVRIVYKLYEEKRSWCVGFRWDDWEPKDILDIAQCLGGKAIALFCRILSEDYAGRTSGLPDLFLWNAAEKTYKFVEVKGPGDTLKDNQKTWIDLMVRNDVPVEKCTVKDSNSLEGESPKKTPMKRGKKRKAAETEVESEEDV